MADTESVVEEIDPLELFPSEWRQPVIGLAYLGQLTETIEFCGHTFVIRTLLPQDRFAISSVLQPYRNTILEVDVFQSAHIAASLVSVDNDDDFCPPLGPDIEQFIRGRLNWLAKNLYPPAIEYLWTEYQLLELKAAGTMKELDRLTKGSQPTTSPAWLDSLIEQANSPEEIDSDSPPSTTYNSD